MPRISESIPDLLGGVSQLAPQRREVNEVESMVNCSLRPAEGVVKRPPTKHIAEIAASATPFSGALVHTINKNATERFWVIVLDGDLKVFSAATGDEIPVSFPDGKTYLNVTASPNEAFRLATFNQTTVVVNREKTVARTSELSAQRGFEALVVVQQTDFDTEYSINVSFDGPVVFNQVGVLITPNIATITHRIPFPEGDAEGATASLSTVKVAFELAVKLDRAYGALATLLTGDKNLLNVQVFGSTIHITAGPDLAPGAEFWIGTQDDLSNQGLQKIQESVQQIEDLPEEGPVGFRIKVEGDPEKSLDDVFYEFTEFNTWKETNQSGIPIALDPATLPLELIHNPNLLANRFPSQVPTATFIGGGPTTHKASYLETQDGVASTQEQLVISPAPGTTVDKFLNLGNANGSPIDLKMQFTLDQTHIVGPGPDPTNPANNFAGDVHNIEVASNTSGSFSTKFVFRVPFLGRARQFEINLNFGGASFAFNDDLRLRVISAAGNLGALTLTPSGLDVTYDQIEIQRISLPDTHYAPGTVMTFTLNGTAFSFTFAAGGTQAEYGAALVTAIEAYGGTPAVTAIFAVKDDRGNIQVTNDDGTTPTLTLFTFDENLDQTIEYFNGGADFVNLGVTVGDKIKNLTDVSEAVISAVATTIITSAALTGGTANAWAAGDKGSAETSAISFACRQPDWAKRLVGTEETNKWPSFDDGTINEVAFLKNRLVLISDENVAMSTVDEFFQFFRSSTLDLLDSDRIDVALSGNKASSLHSAFTWNETLLTWSELGQFVVNGEPFLSPNTVKREATTAYVNTRKVKPVTSERSVYFLTEGQEFTQLWDYRPTAADAMSAEGNRLSVQVPRFMPGSPRGLLAISDPEVVLVLTATDPEKLYVFQHLNQDETRILGGWHEWSFPGVTQILGIGSIDNEVSLVMERTDGSVHIEVLDLWELSEATVDGQESSDDQTPPTFIPDTVTLGLDTFVDPVNTFLSAHTADSGFGSWSTNVVESQAPVWAGAFCSQASSPLDSLTMSTFGGDGGYRCTGDIGDGDMNFFVDVTKKSQFAFNFPLARFLVNASQTGAFFQEGMGVGIENDSSGEIRIQARRHHQGGMIENSEIAMFPLAIDGTVRIGFRRVGLVFSYYRADFGTGANEIALGSFTFGSISSTGLSNLADGFHKGVQLFTESGNDVGSPDRWEYDNLTVEGESPTVSSTNFTPIGLDPRDFPIFIGVDIAGNDETTLRDNGDGTVSWVGVDKTGVTILMGLPVSSTIVLSQLYHRKDFGTFSGKAEVRGNTYIQSLLVALENTTTMSMAVAITGHASFSQDLTEKRSLDAEVMHVQVGGRNTEITLTLSHTTADNFKIVGIEWDGSYYHRIRRTS